MRNARNRSLTAGSRTPIEPDLESLAVDVDVEFEEFPAGNRIAGIAVAIERRIEPGRHVLAHQRSTVWLAVMPARQLDVGIDSGMQVASEAGEIAHAAVVRQVDRLRLIAHEAIDGRVHGFGIELHG